MINLTFTSTVSICPPVSPARISYNRSLFLPKARRPPQFWRTAGINSLLVSAFGEIRLKRFHPKVITSYPSMDYHLQAFWLLTLFSLKQNLSTRLDLGDEKHWTGKEFFIIGTPGSQWIDQFVCDAYLHRDLEVLYRFLGLSFHCIQKKKKDLEKCWQFSMKWCVFWHKLHCS